MCDFSAIEARVLSFLAGEKWRLDVFESDGDIYCASASAMFHVPVEKHGVNSHLRQKGKNCRIGSWLWRQHRCPQGYGCTEMGLTEDELTAAG